MEHNYELRPQRVTPERAQELSSTAFRCGGWSVKGPDSWRSWGFLERLWAVGGFSLMCGAAVAGLALPVAIVVWLLRFVGVLP